ncbi:hypothetical protein P3X46_014973 [Hevea brasiliensis]|uniref:Coenzyme Q-binding protein COQ10 START domain-containing protein n=1 Tax=Hevea brasiliensis TaxID=3981 RepID=A0ABQ9LWX2_HEVBR|nr:uncharacterized protein LOC110653374 isoform X2 [Hevea brasiliensis]KAJ9171635.1 hypothetical protein P3X46_014973 [Hevea brasiliensis]
MRVFAVSRYHTSFPCVLLQASTASTSPSLFPSKFLKLSSQTTSSASLIYLLSQSRPSPHCSNTDPDSLDEYYDDDDNEYYDDDDGYSFVGEDGIFIEIKKLGTNSRRIRSKIAVNASLDTIWNILTDYEKLADFIPGLAVSKLIDKKDKFARLYQIGQQNLPFGLKFNAKAILDCFEKDIETFASGKKRDIEFKMAEGDFQFFEGKWSIEQVDKPRPEDGDFSLAQEFETTLSYFVDVKPKLWLPVHLVEGRLCKGIRTNLSCIREEAQKVIHNTLNTQ